MSRQDIDSLHGLYIEDIEIGMSASFEKTVSERDVTAFATLSGDTNPLHLDEEFARGTRAGQRVVHGMVTASLISTLVGCRLPGPGCLWRVGARVLARAEVVEIMQERQRIRMLTTCQVGETVVIDGEALVWVPSRRAITRIA